MAKEKESFWARLFNTSQPTTREEKVLQYIAYRLGEGAYLEDVLKEDYVRRNASPGEIEEICRNPRLVQSVREKMEKAFGSGELDPSHR